MARDSGEHCSDLQVPSELSRSLQEWLFSIVKTQPDTSSELTKLNLQLWSSHPWLLARLSALSSRFFAFYRQRLLRSTRECQSANKLDKAAFKNLLEQWRALRCQRGNIQRVVEGVLNQEWIKFKSSLDTGRDPLYIENAHLWEVFFKKLNAFVDD
jgi:hypothetical protein